ncbi:guanine nucleotide-binding protein G(I)/G(S)/G(O) subunit gamma-10 isoform X1 [Sus scrofa]|uniref:guanine nucleotide-binding protein G(I)/G(S)/G(O) subunit gamma-10 isoform X1 n=1 Tax=Sus scrofa TaxID=9823 RepID=UPI000A2AFB64|nr:guanine nucleotide-binding protein G(I)/G(S)/G(O) subunit gamma-10 isoform X1 [Sus scrofa]
MSSGASVSALQRLVEQLKLEASVERIKVRPSPAPGLGAWKPPAPAPPRHLWAGEEEAAPEPGAAGPARWRASPQGPRSSGGTGLSGSCRASAILHAKCLQGCPAGRYSNWKQPLPGAQILCFTLMTVGKKFTEECFQAQSGE